MRTCEIPECGHKHFARGWCQSHYERWLRHGDPLAGRRRHKVGRPTTYDGVHIMVRRERGKASKHPCELCGQPASEWAYTHMDPDGFLASDKGLPVSADPGYYVPMCLPCHRRYDASMRAPARHL